MYYIGIVIVLYQCISTATAMCYVRLVAAAAERRHVKPGHVSTSETLQPGTPLTPHYNTLYTIHYTTQPFKHLDPASAASPNQRHIKEPASAAALLT